jgi:Rab GDP dissociation inhibitor
MKDVYDKFGLEPGTRDFIGHAMALYLTDEYEDGRGTAPEAIERIRLYGNSVARYGKSPYIYPLYGLGELPQGFARLSAIYGGTYMLNTHVGEILYEGDKAVGIKATMGSGSDEMKFETKAKMILGDPSYFPGKVKVVGHVLRAICVLKHPLAGTNDSDSCQLIIPQHQVGRRNGKSIQPVPVHPTTLVPKSAWKEVTKLTQLPTPSRHLHRLRLLVPQRLPQGLLDRHRFHHCRDGGEPPPRAAARPRASRQDRGAVHGRPHPHLRAHCRRQGRQHLHLQELRRDVAL